MFRIAFVRGVTLTKWTRAWEERRPDSPLQVTPIDESTPTAVLHDRVADVAFARLPIDEDGLSVIRLYDEVPVVVLPVGHDLERAASVSLADFAGDNLLQVGEDAKDAVELVAAGAGLLLLPQSVARQYNRKDVVAVPVADAPSTTIALVWLAEETTADIDEFVGIVRGRGIRSSRGTGAEAGAGAAAAKTSKPARDAKPSRDPKRNQRPRSRPARRRRG
jgi:DNA-binding transcriptional LysR family regulator